MKNVAYDLKYNYNLIFLTINDNLCEGAYHAINFFVNCEGLQENPKLYVVP